MADATGIAMDTVQRVITHPWAKLTWLALMLVLAACNNGDDGGGGGYGN